MNSENNKYIISGSKQIINQLIEVAYKGLPNMFDKESKLFCYRVKKGPNGIKIEGLSYRYTIISLIGLTKLKNIYDESPINIEDTINNLINLSDKISNIGDYGLLIWLCALAAPEWINRIYEKQDLKNIFERFDDARQGKTTELSWFLAGLSHLALISDRYLKEYEKLTGKIYEIIKKNYEGNGIFGHMNRSSIAGILRGRIGCFADQVYPIYALTLFSKAYGNQDALKIALECAQKICELQGPLGQWWWHYDSKKGKIIGRYPVFSVHQDGMAPMVLFELMNNTGIDFRNFIYKGLSWVIGNNELNINLIDNSKNLIWRCLYLNRYKYLEGVLKILRFNEIKKYNNIKILYECRPYHLGWLLYAFANEHIK